MWWRRRWFWRRPLFWRPGFYGPAFFFRPRVFFGGIFLLIFACLFGAMLLRFAFR